MKLSNRVIGGLVSLILLVSSCENIGPSEPDASATLAMPIEGLSAAQMNDHIRGDEDFAHAFLPEEGLGPIFVSNSCESCHVGDGKGHPLTTLTRFAQVTGNTIDHLVEQGGPQLQHRAIAGYQAEAIPSDANVTAKFVAPAVAGLGYLEEVEDADLIALEDPNDLDGDGISGRLSYVPDPGFLELSGKISDGNGNYIGRYGKKATAIDLRHQVSNAYVNDMGITSDYIINDLSNSVVGVGTGDAVADPEVSAATVNAVVFYMLTLKAPNRRDETSADVINGEEIFKNIGCNSCHLETMKTGASFVSALDHVTFHPYTDLLLHDVGDALDDGYTEGTAASSEWRTPPLWGLGLSKDAQGGAYFLMHDGRATSLEQAIELHGGEALKAQQAYGVLSEEQKSQLIKFLESL